MASEGTNRVLGQLRLVLQRTGCGLSDGQLVGQFVATRDETAFATLVRRHGPMVLNVGMRVLRHRQEAEDAFQATFLVLARKAASLPNREGVASWLHSVAYRVALGRRSMTARKRARERQVDPIPDPAIFQTEDRQELIGLLDRELGRLPEKYRLPIVLCELEGRSRRDIAHHLGIPEGTLSSRLATARKMLASRLVKYSPLFSATAITAAFSDGASASVPVSLVVSTIRATSGTVPAVVASLTQGVMKAMLLAKLRTVTWSLMVVASVGVVGLSYHMQKADAQSINQGGQPGEPQPTARTTGAGAGNPDNANTPARDEIEALRLEIDALRRSLNATRERVRLLEEKKDSKGSPSTTVRSGKPEIKDGLKEATEEKRPADKRAINPAQLKVLEAARQNLMKNPGDPATILQIKQAVETMRGPEGATPNGSKPK